MKSITKTRSLLVIAHGIGDWIQTGRISFAFGTFFGATSEEAVRGTLSQTEDALISTICTSQKPLAQIAGDRLELPAAHATLVLPRILTYPRKHKVT